MTTLVAYEVQTYESGSWQIASMFDDRELALIEARRIEEGLRRRETRVVEEVHHEDSGRTKSKVIYTTPKVRSPESAGTQAQPKSKAQEKKPVARGAAKRSPRPRHRRAVAAEKQPSLVMIGLTLFLIVGFGIAALVALRHFSNLS
jgi:hypothetical protein